VRSSIIDGAKRYLVIQRAHPYGIAYAPGEQHVGLGLQRHGPEQPGDRRRRVRHLRPAEIPRRRLGRSGLHVGRNALDISYVTGYGEVSAQNQHSRWYANWIPRCPTRRAERWPAARTRPGRTLFRSRSWPAVGQFCYIDDIQSWSTNELTINWNAPLAWIASWIADQDEG
jgi:endoglucanase